MNIKLVSFAFALVLSCSIIFWASCNRENPNPDWATQADCTGIDPSSNTYTQSVKTIIDQYCATSGCHTTSSKAGGINLDNFLDTRRAFTDNNALCSIHHGRGCSPMPKNGNMLPADMIQKIDCWAKNGYKE